MSDGHVIAVAFMAGYSLAVGGVAVFVLYRRWRQNKGSNDDEK